MPPGPMTSGERVATVAVPMAGGTAAVATLDRSMMEPEAPPVGVHRAVVLSESVLLRTGLSSLVESCRALQVAAALDTPDRLGRAIEAVHGQVVVAAPADGGDERFFRALKALPPTSRVIVFLAVPGFRIQSAALKREHGFTCVPLDIEQEEFEHCVDAALGRRPAGLDVEELCAGPGGTLTIREQEVLHQLAQGQSNREISESLVVSEDTVKTHLRKTYRKLGVSTRAEAVALYVGQLGRA
jgi:DNA-binding NarL/FixJ family response regulator